MSIENSIRAQMCTTNHEVLLNDGFRSGSFILKFCMNKLTSPISVTSGYKSHWHHGS